MPIERVKPLCKKTGNTVESTCLLECESCKHDAGECLDALMDYYREVREAEG